MAARVTARAVPRSLVWATDLDVLALDRVVERRDGYLVIRSPSNPTHYWGNLLLFDQPPGAGDARRWEQAFETEFDVDRCVLHRTFAWDQVDGNAGRAHEEFVPRGYELEETVGLIATPDHVRPHPRENRDVVVRTLDPRLEADQPLWEDVVELQVASRDDRFAEETHRTFCRRRLEDLRTLFGAGRGAWFVALDGDDRQVLASCGVVVTGARGRFQAVDTAAAARRRGICSRLVVEATRRTAHQHGTRHFVIAADPGYHALALYESLGFQRAERVIGVCRQPAEHRQEAGRPFGGPPGGRQEPS